ncbi:MAG: nucleotidyltransferase family protein [Nitrospirae bacterium]|nr:nucleotidyltransferase family protein [Nitrospirota bacterium]
MKETTLTKENIIKKLRENREILSRYGVKRIGVFGSYAREGQKRGSDIDLMVEFDQEMFGKDFKGLFDAYMKLSSYLEKLFNRKVEILTPDSIRTIRIKEVAEDIQRSIAYV